MLVFSWSGRLLSSSLGGMHRSKRDAIGVAGEGHDCLHGENEHGKKGDEDLEGGHVDWRWTFMSN